MDAENAFNSLSRNGIQSIIIQKIPELEQYFYNQYAQPNVVVFPHQINIQMIDRWQVFIKVCVVVWYILCFCPFECFLNMISQNYNLWNKILFWFD